MAFNNVSLVSATNENTLALASIKTDISLIKVEVPPEYTSLNAALTSKRRIAAEEGTAHQTARRLGILFQDLLPSTPLLLRAYGRRSSEISEKSAAKADGTPTGSIFANFLGADVTSIWAAATSGASSIAAHLLACLLARRWSAPEATSIWVEIVAERKRQVAEEARSGVYKTSLELLLICKDDIPRKDLAEWDAGARAWLQIADEAQMRRQKQLMLIIKNINIPVNTEGSTYNRVLDAWTAALTAMERLISGLPQRVGKGASLIGIASWHLYPDLLVLGESMTTVRFKDDLVSDLGQLTIGLENKDPRRSDGVFWSLPLSHLRFYGDPVVAVSHTRDTMRLSMDELQFVVFGSAKSTWGSHYLDAVEVAGFFQRVYEKVGPDGTQDPELRWLQPLWDASKALVTATGEELNTALAAVALGRRNGRKFLDRNTRHPPPFFGIGHPLVSTFLRQAVVDVHTRDIEKMRFIALKLGLCPEEAIIRVKSARRPVYATAVPHSRCSFRSLSPKHGRWVVGGHSSQHSALENNIHCDCHATGHSCHATRCLCMKRRTTCSLGCHTSFHLMDQECLGCLLLSALEAAEMGPVMGGVHGCANLPIEQFRLSTIADPFCQIHINPPWPSSSSLNFGIGLPHPNGHGGHLEFLIQGVWNDRDGLCGCYHGSDSSTPVVFKAIAGNPAHVALFVRVDNTLEGGLRDRLRHQIKQLARRRQYEWGAEPDKVPDDAEMQGIRGATLRQFLAEIGRHGAVSVPGLGIDLTEKRFDIERYVDSVEAYQAARSLYARLSGATVSLRVIDRPLHSAGWAAGGDLEAPSQFARSRRLACIAYFESGVYDMSPDNFDDVIALSTRNSLYISAILLGDPFEAQQNADHIRHVIGNVGKTGIVLMVAPLAPKVRQPDLGMWKRVAHSRFDRSREDCFAATSLHLSFTEFEMPVDIGQRGSIDRDMHVRVIETIISVYDRADWVADLDILQLYESRLRGNTFVKRLETRQPAPTGDHVCEHHTETSGLGDRGRNALPLTAVDNWEELLNLPEDMGIDHVGVVRSHENWIGRLATACVAAQKGLRTVILPPGDVCWGCCAQQTWKWWRWKSEDCNEDDQDERSRASDAWEQQHGARGSGGWSTSKSSPHGQVDEVDGSDREDSSDDSETDSVESGVAGIINNRHDAGFIAAPHVFIC